VRLFDLAEKKQVVRYAFRPALGLLAYHPADGRIAFASERSPTIRIVEAFTGRTIASIEHDVNHESVAWSPAGTHLAAGDAEGAVHLWEIDGDSPRLLWSRPKSLEPGDPVTRLCFNLRGSLLASYSWSSRFRLLDAQGGDLLLAAEWSPQWFVSDPPGLLISLGNYEYGLAEEADQEVRRLIGRAPWRSPKSFARLHVSPDGRLIASAHAEGVGIYDLESKRALPPLDVPDCISALFSPDGRTLFTGGAVGLQRWPIERGGPDGADAARFGPPETLAEVKGAGARWITLSGDGKTVAIVGDRDRAEIVVVDLAGEKPRKVILRPHVGVDRISLRPDGKRLASGTWLAQDVKVWDVESGKLERTFPFPDSAFVEFSPCGTWLAVMSPQACFLHNARTFEQVRRIEKPSQLGFPGTAVFRRDGKVLAISHERGSLRLIDPATGSELATIESQSTMNYCFAFHPDGNRIFVGNSEGRIHAWDLDLLHSQLRSLGLDWSDPSR
jgi:WD40 repeat protein